MFQPIPESEFAESVANNLGDPGENAMVQQPSQNAGDFVLSEMGNMGQNSQSSQSSKLLYVHSQYLLLQ